MSAAYVVCPVPGCGFAGRGSSQSNARRTLKGHTLRQHGAQFVGEGLPLAVLSSSELAAQLERFRRQQANSRTRRRLSRSSQASAVMEVVGGSSSGSDAGPASGTGWVHSGPQAGNVTPTGTSSEVVPDLSDGQVEDWDLIAEVGLEFPDFLDPPEVCSSNPSNQVPPPQFIPPRNYSTREMVDFFRQFPGRRPSSLARMLSGSPQDAEVDPQLQYWMEVMAILQQSLAQSLLDDVRDCFVVDASGNRAFEHGISRLRDLARHPLDE